MIWLTLALAGGAGAVARDRVARALHSRPQGAWFATVVVNLIGSLALGILVGLRADDAFTRIVGTGGLGGLTTFSTWMNQATSGPPVRRAVFIVGQVGAGVALAAVGVWLGGGL